MVDPITDNCRKNTRFRSACGAAPLVAPAITTTPPGLSERSECAQVAWPTVSIDRVDPLGQPGPALECLVRAQLQGPLPLLLAAAGRPDPVSARPAQQDQRGRDAAAGPLDQHGRAGLEPGPAEQHPVGGQVGGRQAGRLLEGQRRPAWAAGCAAAPPPARRTCRRTARTAASAAGRASRRAPPATGSPITACTTTSLPSSSTPAASQPRIIGSRSAVMPTPRSDHTSWWLSEVALTVTVVQPLRRTARRARLAPVRPAGPRRRSARR